MPYHARIAPVISVRAAYLYDAILIYSQAATNILKDGGDLRDGRLLMQKYVFNQIYTSKQGFQVCFRLLVLGTSSNEQFCLSYLFI